MQVYRPLSLLLILALSCCSWSAIGQPIPRNGFLTRNHRVIHSSSSSSSSSSSFRSPAASHGHKRGGPFTSIVHKIAGCCSPQNHNKSESSNGRASPSPPSSPATPTNHKSNHSHNDSIPSRPLSQANLRYHPVGSPGRDERGAFLHHSSGQSTPSFHISLTPSTSPGSGSGPNWTSPKNSNKMSSSTTSGTGSRWIGSSPSSPRWQPLSLSSSPVSPEPPRPLRIGSPSRSPKTTRPSATGKGKVLMGSSSSSNGSPPGSSSAGPSGTKSPKHRRGIFKSMAEKLKSGCCSSPKTGSESTSTSLTVTSPEHGPARSLPSMSRHSSMSHHSSTPSTPSGVYMAFSSSGSGSGPNWSRHSSKSSSWPSSGPSHWPPEMNSTSPDPSTPSFSSGSSNRATRTSKQAAVPSKETAPASPRSPRSSEAGPSASKFRKRGLLTYFSNKVSSLAKSATRCCSSASHDSPPHHSSTQLEPIPAASTMPAHHSDEAIHQPAPSSPRTSSPDSGKGPQWSPHSSKSRSSSFSTSGSEHAPLQWWADKPPPSHQNGSARYVPRPLRIGGSSSAGPAGITGDRDKGKTSVDASTTGKEKAPSSSSSTSSSSNNSSTSRPGPSGARSVQRKRGMFKSIASKVTSCCSSGGGTHTPQAISPAHGVEVHRVGTTTSASSSPSSSHSTAQLLQSPSRSSHHFEGGSSLRILSTGSSRGPNWTNTDSNKSSSSTSSDSNHLSLHTHTTSSEPLFSSHQSTPPRPPPQRPQQAKSLNVSGKGKGKRLTHSSTSSSSSKSSDSLGWTPASGAGPSGTKFDQHKRGIVKKIATKVSNVVSSQCCSGTNLSGSPSPIHSPEPSVHISPSSTTSSHLPHRPFRGGDNPNYGLYGGPPPPSESSSEHLSGPSWTPHTGGSSSASSPGYSKYLPGVASTSPDSPTGHPPTPTNTQAIRTNPAIRIGGGRLPKVVDPPIAGKGKAVAVAGGSSSSSSSSSPSKFAPGAGPSGTAHQKRGLFKSAMNKVSNAVKSSICCSSGAANVSDPSPQHDPQRASYPLGTTRHEDHSQHGFIPAISTPTSSDSGKGPEWSPNTSSRNTKSSSFSSSGPSLYPPDWPSPLPSSPHSRNWLQSSTLRIGDGPRRPSMLEKGKAASPGKGKPATSSSSSSSSSGASGAGPSGINHHKRGVFKSFANKVGQCCTGGKESGSSHKSSSAGAAQRQGSPGQAHGQAHGPAHGSPASAHGSPVPPSPSSFSTDSAKGPQWSHPSSSPSAKSSFSQSSGPYKWPPDLPSTGPSSPGSPAPLTKGKASSSPNMKSSSGAGPSGTKAATHKRGLIKSVVNKVKSSSRCCTPGSGTTSSTPSSPTHSPGGTDQVRHGHFPSSPPSPSVASQPAYQPARSPSPSTSTDSGKGPGWSPDTKSIISGSPSFPSSGPYKWSPQYSSSSPSRPSAGATPYHSALRIGSEPAGKGKATVTPGSSSSSSSDSPSWRPASDAGPSGTKHSPRARHTRRGLLKSVVNKFSQCCSAPGGAQPHAVSSPPSSVHSAISPPAPHHDGVEVQYSPHGSSPSTPGSGHGPNWAPSGGHSKGSSFASSGPYRLPAAMHSTSPDSSSPHSTASNDHRPGKEKARISSSSSSSGSGSPIWKIPASRIPSQPGPSGSKPVHVNYYRRK
ncbi:unnamed protein product [Sympodiomycopsis kandeliae]